MRKEFFRTGSEPSLITQKKDKSPLASRRKAVILKDWAHLIPCKEIRLNLRKAALSGKFYNE